MHLTPVSYASIITISFKGSASAESSFFEADYSTDTPEHVRIFYP